MQNEQCNPMTLGSLVNQLNEIIDSNSDDPNIRDFPVFIRMTIDEFEETSFVEDVSVDHDDLGVYIYGESFI